MPRSLWMVGFSLCLLGCPEPKPADEPATSRMSEADRPPLRVRMSGSGPLIDAITRRWKSISDQALDIRAIAADELNSSESIKADIVIVESRWLPTMIERGWLTALPRYTTDLAVDATSNDFDPGEWPAMWRRSATYGQRMWGIPLGVPLMVLIEKTPRAPSDGIKSWDQRISDRLVSQASPSAAGGQEETVPDTFLLERFLVLAATMNPASDDTGFLFNIQSARPRLTDRWLHQAATVFGKLYRDRQAMANESPDKAWERVAALESGWAMAWPANAGESTLTVESIKPNVDLGLGLVASLTSMNRQSATSLRFLKWLNDDAQRQEFANYSAAIQPLPSQWSSMVERADVNRYREIVKEALDDRFAVRELCFAESLPFRRRLIEALQRIVDNPENAVAELQQCALEWEQLTVEIGRDVQKNRLARSLNLEAYRP